MSLAPTLEAQIVLERLNELGVAIAVASNGNLRYKPKRKVDDELLAQIKAHKPGIIDLLSPTPETLGATGVIGVTDASDPDNYADFTSDTSSDTLPDQGVIGVTKPNQGVTDDNEPLPPGVVKAQEKAAKLGLIARFSREFGFVGIHDPTTGEWHEVAMEDAPEWAKKEAFRRKALWKSGERGTPTREEMERVYERDAPTMDDAHDLVVTRGGVVYRDYLEEADND